MNRTDPSALVVGPTGLAYDRNSDVLYVASTGDNAVFAIQNAASTNRNGGVGRMIYFDAAHLHGPLALALAPNGHLVTANGDAVNADPQQPSEIVEFTVDGRFIAQMQVDTVPGPRSASRSGTAAKASWNSQPSTTTRIPRRSGPCAPTTTTRSNARLDGPHAARSLQTIDTCESHTPGTLRAVDAARRRTRDCHRRPEPATLPVQVLPPDNRGRSRMTIPFKKLILRGVALAVAAAVGYTGHMLSRLAPIATGYAAKALCSARTCRAARPRP